MPDRSAASPSEHFVLTNPSQEYEDSTEVLGAFGSLAAAQAADRLLRRRDPARLAGRYSEVTRWRLTAAERTWRYYPTTGFGFGQLPGWKEMPLTAPLQATTQDVVRPYLERDEAAGD